MLCNIGAVIFNVNLIFWLLLLNILGICLICWGLSNILWVMSNIISLCIICWDFVLSVGALCNVLGLLYSLSGLCIIFWGIDHDAS